MKIASILFVTSVISVMTLSFFLGAFFFIMHNHTIDFSVLEHYSPGKPSILLDDEGKEWGRFQSDKREPIALESLPDHLIHAFIAAEDWSFFSHSGISYKGIIRSLFVNMYYGRKAQGASTITQQLVRLLFFDAQKTFTRKIKEQLYALMIEQQCTKEHILQTYLNHVYFGCGIYGVEAACQRFWSKHAADVTIDEAAALACIMRSPARYCPILCPISCQKRRDIILGVMLKLGFIKEGDYRQALECSVIVTSETSSCGMPHVKEMIRRQLEKQFDKKELYTGGLTIQTTLNSQLQTQAQKIFYESVMGLRSRLKVPVDGGLMSIEVTTGEIKTLIGGVDFSTSQFNRALQARRQMGSIFKPLVYTAAVQQGAQFFDVEIDEPITFAQSGTQWKPNNADNIFRGNMTLAYALSHSNNSVTIKTLLKAGIKNVINLAQRCHIQGPFQMYPSLALGCIDVSLQEAVGMFNVFANDGVYVAPYCIRWIKNTWGTKIFKQPIISERVISSYISGQVASVMHLWLQRVKKLFPQPWIASEAISKTGTTNDWRTSWFVGSTPDITTGIYVGCDDNSPLGFNMYPLQTSFPIWMELHRSITPIKTSFSYDPTLKKITVNEKTGELAAIRTKGAISFLCG